MSLHLNTLPPDLLTVKFSDDKIVLTNIPRYSTNSGSSSVARPVNAGFVTLRPRKTILLHGAGQECLYLGMGVENTSYHWNTRTSLYEHSEAPQVVHHQPSMLSPAVAALPQLQMISHRGTASHAAGRPASGKECLHCHPEQACHSLWRTGDAGGRPPGCSRPGCRWRCCWWARTGQTPWWWLSGRSFYRMLPVIYKLLLKVFIYSHIWHFIGNLSSLRLIWSVWFHIMEMTILTRKYKDYYKIFRSCDIYKFNL